MLNRVLHATPLDRHRLFVEFDDGVCGTLDLSARLFGEMFEPLRDETMFRQVFVDDLGTVSWPNGADLAPDALHQILVQRRFPSLASRQSASAAITNHDDCLRQLLDAIADIDKDDINQAAQRLARVHEWIIRETKRVGDEAALQNAERVAG
jgi:uncharacterized protein DUF2442